MTSPRPSSSYSCALIWALLSWGVLGWGEAAFATAQKWPSGGSGGKVETNEEEFFDADDRDFDKRTPPKSYYQTICDSVTGVCRTVYGAASSATAATVDAAGAPIRWAGAQAVRGAAEETDRQLRGDLGNKTLTDVASKTTAAAVKSAAETARTPEVQKAVEQTANTAAYGAVKGGKEGLIGKKRPSLTSQSSTTSTTSEKSTTSKKSLSSRAVSKASSAVTYIPKQIGKGAKKAASTVKQTFTKTPSSPKPGVKPAPLPPKSPKKSPFSFPTPWKNKSIPVAKVPPMPRRPSNAPPPGKKGK